MVEPETVGRILLDAARLIREGEIVVFGSAALALWFDDAPRTKDVDLWCVPAERGDLVEALMGMESWYQVRHGASVVVWAPETFAAPSDWRDRAKILDDESVPKVRLVVPHPHDVLMAKLERWEDGDHEHARLILANIPLDRRGLARLAARAPHRQAGFDSARVAAFEAHLDALRQTIPGG